jgi:autotransporter-associated beta strand protein
MKLHARIKPLLPGVFVFATILCAELAPAATIVQTVNQSGADANGWASAIWGTPAAIANGANDYLTPSGFAVRTPNNTSPAAFAGFSLTVSNGIFYLKHNNNTANVNLILNGGTITYHGGPGGSNSPVSGTIQVLTAPVTPASTINSDQTGTANLPIWLYSSISGPGNLIVNVLSNGAVVLLGTNSNFSGNWTNTSGTIVVGNNSVNALGSGLVSLNFGTSTFLKFDATNNLVVTNSIMGLGNVIKLNTDTVTLNGTVAYTGTTTISNGVLQIGANSSLTNSSVISLAGGTVDASQIGGLTLGANGQRLNGNGSVIGDLTASTTNTLNFNLTAASNDVLNVTGLLTLNGNPNLNLALNGFKPSGTYRLINYSGTIQGGGSFTLNPPPGSTESFALDTSTPGQVNLVVTGSSLNLTWVGDSAANVWDTNAPNWSGSTNVYAVGANVTFDDTGSAVPDITIASSTLFPSSMTVSNTSEQYIFDGAGGTVGIVTAGTLTKMGTNELDFTSSGNNFSGPIDIRSGVLSAGIGGSFGSLGTGPITNNGVLQVNMSGNGVAFNAPISGSGSLQVIGGGVIVTIGTTGHNTYTGLTTIGDGCQLNIAASDALGATSSGTVVLANGRLGVASFVGAMTVAEPVTINGTGISGAPGALYVNTTGNNVTWSGPITVASSSQIRAVNANARMNFANIVSGTDVALECTAGNIATTTDTNTVITFANTLSLGNAGALTADGLGVVALAGATNTWGGGTTLNGAVTLLVNGVLDGGPVAVNNSTTLGGSGTILGPVTVDGVLAPGNASIGTLTVSNTVTLNSDATNVMRLNRTNAQNADQLAATSLTLGGVLNVVNVGDDLRAGDTFQLFTAAGGAFALTNLPPLTPPLFWDTTNLDTGVIVVRSTSVVPLPWKNSVVQVAGTNLTFEINPTTPGASYTLQSTPSLTSPIIWTDVQTVIGDGTSLMFTNPITPGTPDLFFRTRSP